MAGLNESAKPVGWDHDRDINASPDLSDKSERDPKLKDFDLEGQGRRGSQHNVTAIDGSSTTESVGRQIDMESENTIKYRTCSWQKVRVLDKENIHWFTNLFRPPHCSSLSTFAWPLCPSLGRIQFWAWFPVSS